MVEVDDEDQLFGGHLYCLLTLDYEWNNLSKSNNYLY
jgi:hypothetical protein